MTQRISELDAVDWAHLKHAYGPAIDVPNQIRALASADPKAREEAEYELYGNIFHEGTRYQATPHAIPFLLELTRDPKTPARANIVSLLVFLAIGYDEYFIPDGIDAAKFRAQRRAEDVAMSPDERARCAKYGYGPLVDVACYDAAAQGVPLVRSLLDDADVALRFASAFLLAWFPEHAGEVVSSLQALLANTSEPLEQAHVILALGLLARHSTPAFNRETMLPYLKEPHSLLVRTAAAIALSNPIPNDETLDILIEAMTKAEALNEATRKLEFNRGNLVGFASLVLSRASEDHRERAVAALCRALAQVDILRSSDVTNALLDLVIDERDARYNFFKRRTHAQLTSLQHQALLAILSYGGWSIDVDGSPSTFVNYSQLLSSYGLPGSAAELRSYLEGG